ncbi:hypothetical protein AAHC03_019141 [Spirometra sp. Aus1]
MRAVVVAAATAVPASVLAVPKTAKKHAARPPFGQMIVEAIGALQGRNGSSRQAILKYIKVHHNMGEKVAGARLRRALVAATVAGKLVQTKGSGASGSFKLPEKVQAPVRRRAAASPVQEHGERTLRSPRPEKMRVVTPKDLGGGELGRRAATQKKRRVVVIPRKAVRGSRLRAPAVKSTVKK